MLAHLVTSACTSGLGQSSAPAFYPKLDHLHHVEIPESVTGPPIHISFLPQKVLRHPYLFSP